MAYAHSRGILHRDLKPRNVMLGKYDETLVVDWGLAKPVDRDEAARSVGEETLMPGSGSSDSGSDTPTVGVVGTPAYMSPEQAEARWDIVGPASDIFSLGGILYAMLTGQAPYQGRKVGEILEKVKRCEFPGPRQIKPGLPRAGGNLPQGDGEASGGSVCNGSGPGGGRAALVGRRAGDRLH